MIYDKSISPINYEIFRPETPFEAIQKRAHESRDEEIDLLKEIEKKYEEDQMKKLAEANDAWIKEYRLKMFRNVLNNGRMPRK